MNGIYIVDATLAAMILLATMLVVASRPLITPLQAPIQTEKMLSKLLAMPGFVDAIYSRDSRTVEAYLDSFIAAPYNLTVWDTGGGKVLSVGSPVEGVAAVAVLPGWRGRAERLTISLRVGG